MKITRIETIPIRVPLKAEFAIRSSRGAHVVSPFLLVRVHTDQGLVGVGEASCTPRWSGEDQVTGAHLIRSYLEPLLLGENPVEVARLEQKFRLAFAGNYFTKAAVEMALWDIAGQAAGKPIYELLGGKVRDVIPTKWSVSGVDPSAAAGIARWAVAQGFVAMKIKVGTDPERDVERVRAVRAAIGSNVKVGVDANGGWSADVAVNVVARLSEFNVSFVEQPLPPEDVLRLLEIKPVIRVPIVADESVYTLLDAMILARLRAADAISVYVGKAGGIGEARKIAEFAQSAGLKCTVGSNLELGVGSAAMIHLAIATPGITANEIPCDIIGPLYYQDDIVREPLPIQPGQARPSPKPGLGVELDEDKVERYRVKEA
jgi:muconate cycloisomerase